MIPLQYVTSVINQAENPKIMIFQDFEHKLRTDPVYYDKVQHAIQAIQNTYDYTRAHNSGYNLHHEAIMDYLKLTNFNLSPLLGFYFPKYPGVTPYSLKDFPFAHCYYNLNIGPGAFTVFRSSRQIGKCVAPETKITVRNKTTGEVKTMTISEFHDLQQ